MSTNQGCFMSIHHGAQWSQSGPLRPKSPQQPSRTIGPDAIHNIHSFSNVRGTELDENARNVSLYKTNQNYSRKQLVKDSQGLYLQIGGATSFPHWRIEGVTDCADGILPACAGHTLVDVEL